MRKGKLKNTKIRVKLFSVSMLALMALSSILPFLDVGKASAAQLSSRKLTLSSTANGNVSTNAGGVAQAAGSGGNGAKARHTFDFTVPGAASTVQSIEFLYCTTPVPGTTCTAPTGMDASTVASIAGQTGLTGFSLGSGADAPTANRIRITRTDATNVSSDTAVQYYFGQGAGTDWIKNPTTDNSTFFVRVKVFTDTAYTTERDKGTVASSTAQQIDITAKVQEKLTFSVGSTYVAPGSGCSGQFSDTGALTLGDSEGVLDSATQYDNHSWFRITTNATNGTKIYYSADTLKDGSNDINALTSEVTTSAGTEAFGLALNSGETGHSFTDLTANTGYDEGNGALGTAKFNFATGSVTTPVEIASSSGIVGCDTGSVRYVGNIATSTPAGIYTTTVTFIAVPTF